MHVPERQVRCYHCRGTINVPRAARTASCPLCYKGLVLDDLHVKDAAFGSTRLVTCGKVVVERKGRAVTRTVEAGDGVEVEGTLEAKVTAAGPVLLTSTARLKGELEAPELEVELGAVIRNVYLRIGLQ
jgi:hypothetical protein